MRDVREQLLDAAERILLRDDLRARLRRSMPTAVSLLHQATEMIAACLRAERDLGRLAPDADVDSLASTLIGAGHLLFADRDGPPPTPAAIRKVVAAVLPGA
ncbi:hypothetical protein ACIQCJ_25765 [Streptomyces sp. NPDC093221]|uniref:hypothetical protein n=1 Tax=Streptomyces sp. NPDC093221 TaxID=3366032 RepID=UPI003830B098